MSDRGTSVYLPTRYRESDLGRLDELLAHAPFITLITAAGSALPQVTHLPVLYRRDGDTVRLEGHWARANPQCRASGQALAIVHGPHSYISPRWYLQPQDHVPTWNYAVAHLSGPLRTFEDADALQDLVTRLASRFEPPPPSGWQAETQHPEFRRDLRGIVGFDMVVERVDLKFKLNQHYPAGDRRGVVHGLRGQADADARHIADWMQARLDEEGGPSDDS